MSAGSAAPSGEGWNGQRARLASAQELLGGSPQSLGTIGVQRVPGDGADQDSGIGVAFIDSRRLDVVVEVPAADALERDPTRRGRQAAAPTAVPPGPSPLSRLGRVAVRKRLFLRWALINTLASVLATTAAVAFLDDLGTLGASSRASVVIVAVFVAMSAYCGTLMWRADGILDRAASATVDGGGPGQPGHGGRTVDAGPAEV